jgi:hypothetical protein
MGAEATPARGKALEQTPAFCRQTRTRTACPNPLTLALAVANLLIMQRVST